MVNSVALGNFTNTAALSIVVGGQYFDGTRINAQLLTLTASPTTTAITVANAGNWFTVSNTTINSVAVGSFSGGPQPRHCHKWKIHGRDP